MFRILSFLIGIILMSIGLFFIFIYLNLFTLGYSFFEFVKFIIIRIEVLSFFIGIIFVYLAVRKEKIHGILLRHIDKFKRK